MQKNQNFSCLFRHYAKHNGLRKEDLVFYFTDELLPDQTPESAHLMPFDEILVSHKTKKINECNPTNIIKPKRQTITSKYQTHQIKMHTKQIHPQLLTNTA